MHRLVLASLLLAFPAAAIAQGGDGARDTTAWGRARSTEHFHMGADGELRFRLGERGTPNPIHLRIAHAEKARAGRERVAGTLPLTLRLEHEAARSWAASADSLFGRAPVANDSATVALAAMEGEIALVRIPDDHRRGRYRLHVASAAGRAVIPTDSAEAWAFVQMVRGAGELLDPEGKVDPARVYRWQTEIDKPAVIANGTCHPRYPVRAMEDGITGEVQVQFVVTSIGRADPESFKVLKSSNAVFERAVRDALDCMRFLPAEVRGRPVRMLVQQPFRFDIAEGR